MSGSTDQQKPNFLIAGPTKSGTTSLGIYINQHPDIFIPAIKEPNFLGSKVVELPFSGRGSGEVSDLYITSFKDYLALYADRQESCLGDASANTIYYGDRIVPVIGEYLNDPKIIIILRDPVKRAFSAYTHLVRDNREELSFEEALQAENKRIDQNYDPLFHYRHGSLYADNVASFRKSFSDVLILFTSELHKDPVNTCRRVFSFLGVDDKFQIQSAEQHNISGKPKSQFLSDLVSRETPLRRILRPLIRTFTSEKMREKAVSLIQKRNLTKLDMKLGTEAELRAYFKDDIQKLEAEIGEDLRDWYQS